MIAKILEPIRTSQPKIPVEILAIPKGKDAPKDALNAFIALFASVVSPNIYGEHGVTDYPIAKSGNVDQRRTNWEDCQ